MEGWQSGECSGLLNRRPRKGSTGSNPVPSAFNTITKHIKNDRY